MEYATRPLSELFADIASPSAAPGGGTAGAMVAATGTALCEMTCIHLRAADAPVDVDLAAPEAELMVTANGFCPSVRRTPRW